MGAARPNRRKEPHLVCRGSCAVAFREREKGGRGHEVARQPLSHRWARGGSPAPLPVLAAHVCRQPRPQPRSRTLWHFGFYSMIGISRRKHMPFAHQSNRRGFMKVLAASPLLAQIAAQQFYEKSAAAMGLDPRGNVYRRLGVKTVINCRGTWTYLSGSLQFPEALDAEAEAGRYFVNLVDLQRAVGRRLAELTGAESGIITSGAAGAMAAATAACMAGNDPQKIWQLPDTTGLKHEVIMVGGRSAFDSAIRLAGAKLILVEKPDDIANAIHADTAMIYTTDLGDKLEREASIAKEHNVPLLLDDAAGIPPIENIKLYAQMKLDLYTFSGGKGLRGPQCSGVLLGRRDLIEAALRNSCPFEGAVCRPMNVGKEEVIGCLTAIETWLKTDPKKLYDAWHARVDRIATLVQTGPGGSTEVYLP